MTGKGGRKYTTGPLAQFRGGPVLGSSENPAFPVVVESGPGSSGGGGGPTIQLPWILATEYGVVADGTTDDTTALQAAMDAAAAANGCLVMPSGTIRITAAIVVTVLNGMAVRGTGKKTTHIRQDSADDGLYFDLSTGTPKDNSVELRDFIISANNDNCGTALTITYGTSALGSIEDRSLCNLDSLEVSSWDGSSNKGWENGYDFVNCWHITGRNLYAVGNANTYDSGSGAGSGFGLRLNSGVNQQWGFITLEFFDSGLTFGSVYTGGGCQGILVDNFLTVEVNRCINAPAASGDFFGTLQVTNFLFDNGNIPVANHESVYVTYAGQFILANGQILQNLGTHQVYLSDVSNATLTGIDFSYQTGITRSIDLAGACEGARVVACKFGGAQPYRLGASTYDCEISGNVIPSGGSAASDSGTNNRVGNELGFTVNKSLSGGSTDSFTVDTSRAGLGKKPTAAPVQLVDPATGSKVIATYDYSSGSNSAQAAVFAVQMSDLGTLPTGSYRFSGLVTP